MGARYTAYAPPTVAVTDDLGQQGMQNPFTQQAFQSHPLGFSCVYRGTTYYYCRVGSSDIAIGLGVSSAANTTNHLNKAVSAAVAIGGNVVIPTMGATATIADDYKDGVLSVSDATGEGQSRRIASNTAAASAGTPSFTLKDGLTIALVASTSLVTPMRHPHKDVVVAATTIAAPLQGVTVIPLTGTYYGWLASAGYADVLVDASDTLVVGNLASIPAATAGTTGAAGVGNGVVPIAGRVMYISAAGNYATLDLTIRAYSETGI